MSVTPYPTQPLSTVPITACPEQETEVLRVALSSSNERVTWFAIYSKLKSWKDDSCLRENKEMTHKANLAPWAQPPLGSGYKLSGGVLVRTVKPRFLPSLRCGYLVSHQKGPRFTVQLNPQRSIHLLLLQSGLTPFLP